MNLIKKLSRFYLLQVFLICLVGSISISETVGQQNAVQMFQAQISMKDGIKLTTDIYLPNKKGKFPAILIRTPYASKNLKLTGESFAKRDYAVVIQNVRGTSGSGGRFIPFVYEKSDGVSTLEWICRQDWNNSKVGFWGASYLAFSGLQIASSGKDCLAAGINISGWTEIDSFIYEDGVFRLGDHLPWLVWQSTGKFQSAKQINKIFMTKPLIETFGSNFNPRIPEIKFNYEKVNIPILHITGWFDYIYKDTLRTYNKLKAISPKSNAQKLIIGHWSHNEIYLKTTKAGDEDFGTEAAMGFEKLVALSVKWFDFHLKGVNNGMQDESNVKYLVMGENRWRKANKWAPEKTDFKKWYLQKNKSGGKLGVLSRRTRKKKSSSSFIYDPNNPVPTVGGVNSHFLPWLIGIKDQRFIEKRNDVLIFDSRPLKKSIILAGPIRAIIYASTEGKDTDFTAKLVEVRSDGYAKIIENGIKRGSFLKEKNSKFLEPQKIYKFEIDLGATAVKLQKGSRIRLEISSSNFPKYTRNPNTGKNALNAAVFKSVKQMVFHSKRYPSQLILPILK